MEPENQPRREYLLTAAGSQEVNGSYTVSSENDLFYKKRYSPKDSASVVYIITLESLPELGEDFEVAWVLQSHNAVSDEAITFYATPCDDPESLAFPIKGWITVSGLEPVPQFFPRPMQHPRGRSSNLEIIEENEEVDFSIEPFWANEDDPDGEFEDDLQGTFDGWDQDQYEYDLEDWDEGGLEEPSSEGEESDYGEIELPDDIMENFQDGHFVHKQKPQESSADDQRVTSPRGTGNEVDSDTSEDITIVRHDTNRDSVDQSDLPERPSISSQVDEKELADAEENEEKINLPSQRRFESGICSENIDVPTTATVDLKNPHLAYARSLGVKGEITIVDLRSETPMITGARVGSRVLRHARNTSGRQDELDFRIASPPYRPLIAPPKDPFMPAITVHSRSRTSRDHFDVDLISSVVPEMKRRNSARMTPGGNEPPRRKSQRKRSRRSLNVEKLPDHDEAGVEEKEAKKENKVTTVQSVEQTIPSGDVKPKAQPVVTIKEEKRDPEREKLEEEMHQLKTKMRKCDRLSKLRKRGRNLNKQQQDTLVHKSKYQRRIEELRRLLGSDIGR